MALGINKLPDVERLLTAVRRVLLLEAGPEKLTDRTLHMLAMCLAEHGLSTGYVWMSQADEDAAAPGLSIWPLSGAAISKLPMHCYCAASIGRWPKSATAS